MSERHDLPPSDTPPEEPTISVSTELKPDVFKDLERSAYSQSRDLDGQLRYIVEQYLYGFQGFLDRLLSTQKDQKRHEDDA